MFKKSIAFIVITILAVTGSAFPVSAAFAPEKPAPALTINAKSYILMEQATGQVLAENNADAKLPMANVAKVMSLLLICNAVDEGKLQLDEMIPVSEEAASMGGTQAFLDANEEYTASDLLKSVIIASANDACVALGERLYGSEETFVQAMNEKAQELGMANSCFANCTGLFDEDQYSSARDIAICSRELCRCQSFFKWGSVWMDTLEHKGGRITDLTNPNKLVKTYNGCDGLRTGSANDAQYCISATAKRGQMRLIAVVLGAPDSNARFSGAQKLMDYGFSAYNLISVAKKGDVMKKDVPVNGGNIPKVNIIAGADIGALVERGFEGKVEKIINLPESVEAPLIKGQAVGEVILKLKGEEILRTNLVVDRDVRISDFFDSFLRILFRWIYG
ncbi:MAG: D-alanyl-D-alanine carboxypeptidase family protein [Bacillota bacterium]|nr:D-alanyl-D-alanine carboxypeptidase family protein [Bacillota bacterium]